MSMIKKFNRQEFKDKLIKDKLSPNTINSYMYDADILQIEIKADLCKVSVKEFEDFQKTLLGRGNSSSTINRYACSLNRIYKDYGVSIKLSSSYEKIAPTALIYIQPKVIDAFRLRLDETDSLLCRDTLLITLLYATGLKISDALTLRIRDIELEGERGIKVAGVSWLNPNVDLRSVFDTYYQSLRNPSLISHLFYTKKDKSKPMGRKSAWRDINLLFKKYNLDISSNDLRTSYGFAFARRGLGLKELAKAMKMQEESARVYMESAKMTLMGL